MPTHGHGSNSCPVATGSEPVTLRDAIGRVLSTQLMFPADRPDRDLALVDGHAVQAESTLGASVYNPLFLTLVPEGVALTAGRASSCNAGDALPPGADAVLPLEIGEAVGSVLEVCDGIARGAGVGAKGQAARFGDVAVAAGRRLEAPQIALAASLGVAQLTVRRRPEVALLIAGAKPHANEALGVALSALVARDGGMAHCAPLHGGIRRMPAALAETDIVLVLGRSGRGRDDDAERAVAAAGGRIDRHGIAMMPGGSAGVGSLGGAPLLLLPGDPLSALASYELLAGRLVRRLAGRPSEWPYPVRRIKVSQKIASPVGVSEWIPVVYRNSSVEPLPLAPADGLVGYAGADGFLVVPASLEGYAPGERVDVVAMTDLDSAQDGS